MEELFEINYEITDKEYKELVEFQVKSSYRNRRITAFLINLVFFILSIHYLVAQDIIMPNMLRYGLLVLAFALTFVNVERYGNKRIQKEASDAYDEYKSLINKEFLGKHKLLLIGNTMTVVYGLTKESLSQSDISSVAKLSTITAVISNQKVFEIIPNDILELPKNKTIFQAFINPTK
ncbi:hypothetical protein AN639_02160 [Candidatus Epulonipiscium fishelsonii]|uniref:Uncharacterized protein n=1 Tax=Candidatus Epulonipiscium fishelsonii TaxID=77094 RepID=A0ACC8XEP9_9FIRM|nr:hypothetical protein AN396_03140 [Epulopiscium sp. SCG-B11WGA-EpuloA1]ONI43128.1 hypothetical protein AN639_02160 [Epulopiscium sp. SCG-B05WGA-EpuloA1]